MSTGLSWLPAPSAWDAALEALQADSGNPRRFAALTALAQANLDFVRTAKLDRVAAKLRKQDAFSSAEPKVVRLALLGSSTLNHLLPGIRVAGLRRSLWIEVYEADFGQYRQELMETGSALHRFRPQFVCLALDSHHLLAVSGGSPMSALGQLRECWTLAQEGFHCTVIQQNALPLFPDLMGNNEHRLSESPQSFVRRLNIGLEAAADKAGVQLLAVDKYAALQGLRTWHDPGLWNRSKFEVHPAVAPLYGEYLFRIVAAQLGLSAKCLVLDLDNTLWGGVIGDDGLEGIVLGQGNAAGESFVEFQRYVLQLKDRGVILAVCSKNDESNALLPFEKHPEMVLKRTDIAHFVANWKDKPTNLADIARALNIGIDALVFVDDNPFERNLVRQELPQVAVPEMPEDPAFYVDCLASASYFETLVLTDEDRERASLYRANAERESLREGSTNLASYLENLNMELTWQRFDELSLKRVVQLINKTNQFNLTTRRYSEAEVREVMSRSDALGLHLRLSDRFGDNGIIAILIGRLAQDEPESFEIDTWLMSCRVLGRQVEEASLNLLVQQASHLGAQCLVGEYHPTPKNGMVRELYAKLGFVPIPASAEGHSRWRLDFAEFKTLETFIRVREAPHVGI